MASPKVYSKESILRKVESLEFGTNIDKRAIEIFGPPLNFVKEVLNFHPFQYQKQVFLDDSNRMVLIWGRQIGKSVTIAAKAIREAMSGKKTILLFAPTQRQSSLLFNKVVSFISGNILLSASVYRMTQTLVEFVHGSQIHSLPAGKGYTIRGFTADLIIIDEAAFLKDEAMTAIMPMLATTNGKMILMGTPFGKKGRFYEASISENYSKSHHTSYECPLISNKFLEEEKERMTEMEFKQEWLAEFIEEADTFFTRDILFGSREKNYPGIVEDYELRKEIENDYDYYLGVDFARQGEDYSVFIVVGLHRYSHKMKVSWMEETQKKRLTDAAGRIQILHNIFHFKRIFLDETGLGAGPTDVLIEKRLPCEPVTMTQQAKEELYFNLKKLMEDGTVMIPHHDKLIRELHNVVYEIRSNKHISFHHEGTKIKDDYADALSLGCFGAKKRTGRYTPTIA